MKVDTDGNVLINVEELMESDAVKRALCQSAVFDEVFIEGIGKLLVHGNIEYHTDDTYRPWWVAWSGKGDVFERCRKLLVKWAPRSTQRLVADLETERDRLWERCEELQRENRELESRLQGIANA